MRMNRLILQPLAAAALLCIVGASQAALVVYTTQASFLAAVSAASTDTFAGFAVTGVTAGPITRAVGPYGYTATAASGFYGGGTAANPYL